MLCPPDLSSVSSRFRRGARREEPLFPPSSVDVRSFPQIRTAQYALTVVGRHGGSAPTITFFSTPPTRTLARKAAPTIQLGNMRLAIRLRPRPEKRMVRGHRLNRRRRGARFGVLEALALHGFGLCVWRWLFDFELVQAFPFHEGILSHWQTWFIGGVVLQLMATRLARHARGSRELKPRHSARSRSAAGRPRRSVKSRPAARRRLVPRD